MPILGLEPTQSISEGYCQHALNSLGCRKKYAHIGTRTNTVYFRRLLATRVQLRGLYKEVWRYWDSNQHSLFPKATGITRSTTWASEINMPIMGLEPTQSISEGFCQHVLNSLGFRKKYAAIRNRINTFYFRRLLATRLQLPVLQKEYAVIGTRTNTVYFRRLLATGVQLPGLQKKYADIGIRNNTIYFRRLLLARLKLPGLQEEICRNWDSNQHSLFP